jgi:hypothetical protein
VLAHRAVLDPAEDTDQHEQEHAEERHREDPPPSIGMNTTVRIRETTATREPCVRIWHLLLLSPRGRRDWRGRGRGGRR